MKKLFVMVLVLLALPVSVRAQNDIVSSCIDGRQTVDGKCAQFTFGVDLLVGKPTGLELVDFTVSKTAGGSTTMHDMFVPIDLKYIPTFYGGWTSERGFGLMARASFFKSLGTLEPMTYDNVVGGALTEVLAWGGQNVRPIKFSSGPIGFSPTTTYASADWKFRRFEAELTKGLQASCLQTYLFAGVSYLGIENSRTQGQLRDVLLGARLPNGQPDPISILENFTFETNESMTYHGIGPVFGVEVVSYPFFGGMFFQARVAQAFVMGNVTETGVAFSHLRGSLVPTAQGYNGKTATTYVVDTSTPLSESYRATVSLTDLQATLGVRFGALELRGGVGVMRMGNVPVAPSWVIKPAQSFQFGSHQSATTNITSIGPMFSVALRF